MGIDCFLFDKEKYYSLDRWYVFGRLFESKKEYTRRQIKKKLRQLWKLSKTLERENEDRSYYKHWIKRAQRIVRKSASSKFIFYTDNDAPDQLYERGYNERNRSFK